MTDDEYSLKIDDQVQSFLELKHKLTFFLRTAAIGSLCFTLAFSIERFEEISASLFQSTMLYAGTATALLSVGLALSSLYCEIRSYQYHLRYRYEKKSWNTLSPDEQDRWTLINKLAGRFLIASFIVIVLSVVFQSGVFVADLSKGEVRMHHYGEDSTEVSATESGFNIVFRNKETAQEIRMYIPRVGVMEDPARGLTMVQVRQVADEIAHLLRVRLQ
jgi:hypothetical protein